MKAGLTAWNEVSLTALASCLDELSGPWHKEGDSSAGQGCHSGEEIQGFKEKHEHNKEWYGKYKNESNAIYRDF